MRDMTAHPTSEDPEFLFHFGFRQHDFMSLPSWAALGPGVGWPALSNNKSVKPFPCQHLDRQALTLQIDPFAHILSLLSKKYSFKPAVQENSQPKSWYKGNGTKS